MSKRLNIQFVQEMPDTEILRIAKNKINDLTPEAREVLEEELLRRNLYLNTSDSFNYPTSAGHVETKHAKSIEFAFLLALFFGPFGTLYVSATYGIILITLGVIGFALLNFIGLAIVWIISIVIALQVSDNSKNSHDETIQPTKDRAGILNQLSQLHTLKEKGIIPEEIYEQERKKALAKLALFDS